MVGIGGALLGWAFLDLLAAALMGFMILRMGCEQAWGAIKELIDTGLDDAQIAQIRQTLLATPGVRGLHDLRTRRMAHRALVDAHVQVDARISVSEGHRIAESARAKVLREHAQVLDVLVHIDPEDDLDPDIAAIRLPSRDALLEELQSVLAEMPPPHRVILHYLNGGVEIEVFLDHAFFTSGEGLRQAEMLVAQRLKSHPGIRSVSLNCRVAPR